MNKKGFLDISFSWIFAIIVGIMIIIGAVYGLSKFVRTEKISISTEGAREIEVILNPLETSFETGESTMIFLPVESRIYTSCYEIGDFGRQGIRISEKSKNEWGDLSPEVSFYNKYLFLSRIEEGKSFYLFSKPFYFPFKTANLIYLTSSKNTYCFVEAPEDIKEELEVLAQENIHIDSCGQDDIKVCFEQANCDINVDYENEFLTKDKDKFYFHGDALMYAAIFSSKEMYECQTQRLMKRASSLIDLYIQKSFFSSKRGCPSDVSLSLEQLKTFTDSFEKPSDFGNLNYVLEIIENENKNSKCRLW